MLLPCRVNQRFQLSALSGKSTNDSYIPELSQTVVDYSIPQELEQLKELYALLGPWQDQVGNGRNEDPCCGADHTLHADGKSAGSLFVTDLQIKV